MFVAMNRITCRPEYIERFESLFSTRAREVDTRPGFQSFHLLRPLKKNQPYIVMTFWDRKEDFESWMHSGEFTKGHSRGFADLDQARKEGSESPMTSNMELYEHFPS
jgi:heme oxygenase (mycobilin-producing)